MNLEQAWPGEQNHETLERLRGIYRTATDALPKDAGVMEPDEVVVETLAADGTAAAGEWPSNLVGHLHGDDARRAVRLSGVGPMKAFKINDKTYGVKVTPVLPILSLPSQSWPEGGLPSFDSMIAYSAPSTPYRYDQTGPGDAAEFYRYAMLGRGWRLVKEEKDALQVWVRDPSFDDPIVILRFETEHMEIDLRQTHRGVPHHPKGVFGVCDGKYCELVNGEDADEVEAWFREYLGYLGWREVEPNTYERDDWRLHLDFKFTEGSVEVRHECTSIQPSGWPLPPTPTRGK